MKEIGNFILFIYTSTLKESGINKKKLLLIVKIKFIDS